MTDLHIQKSPKLFDSSSKKENLFASFAKMVDTFGEPYRNGEPNYPDDDHKTDVCWHVLVNNTPVVIWNFKNGPAYQKHGSVENISVYSLWCTKPDVIQALVQLLEEKDEEI